MPLPPNPNGPLDPNWQEDRRRTRLDQTMAAKQAPAVQPNGKPATAPLLTNNYMGPPDAPVQTAAPEPPRRAGPTGFVGYGQQYAANQEAAARMANQAGQTAIESGQVGALQTEAGRREMLRRSMGRASQLTDLDAAMANTAGADYFAQLESQYGADAQGRQARTAAAADADLAARKETARANQAARDAAAKAEAARKEAAIQSEVNRLRRETAISGSEVRGITPEQWAAMNGMSLEEWVRNGKNPPY